MKIKFPKKILTTVLVIALVFQMMPIFSAAGATSDWTGYIAISTKAELNNVRNNLWGKYYLTADIVFTSADFALGGAFYNGGAGWKPIGTDFYTPFSGTFDGNGHTISGLYCNIGAASTSDIFAGLFGCNEGTIQNLGMTNGNITVNIPKTTSVFINAGGIAGWNRDSGTITNCYNWSSVSATSVGSENSIAFVGGIAGYNCSVTITDCYNTGNVSASTTGCFGSSAEVGGIVGNNSWCEINSCYNTGNVSATSTTNAYAGGIVAENDNDTLNDCYNYGSVGATSLENNASAGGISGDADSTFINCHNTGSVNAASLSDYYPRAGGIAGIAWSSTITGCYNTGSISVSSKGSGYSIVFAGGILGDNYEGSMISNCYNTGSVSATLQSGPAYVGGIAGDNYGAITGCYNIGSVSSTTTASSFIAVAGGIAGQNENSGTITGCYNLGSIRASAIASYATDAGGIAGININKITNCYYLNNISRGVDSGSGTTSLTQNQIKQQSSFVGFDFVSTWQMNNYSPYLKGFTNPVVTFDTNGGSSVANLTTNNNTIIGAPTAPTKTGYIFTGWYTSQTNGSAVTFPYTVNSDVTLTAKWLNYTPGDIDGDSVVDLRDVTSLSRYIAGWQNLTLASNTLDVLDIDKDGITDLKDVTTLSRRVAGWNI